MTRVTQAHPVAHHPPKTAGLSTADLKTWWNKLEDDPRNFPAAKNAPASVAKEAKHMTHEYGGDDYQTNVFTTNVNGNKIYIAINDNDGGSYFSFFNAMGKQIAGGSQGESGDYNWDK
jgi:hypothetical protein